MIKAKLTVIMSLVIALAVLRTPAMADLTSPDVKLFKPGIVSVQIATSQSFSSLIHESPITRLTYAQKLGVVKSLFGVESSKHTVAQSSVMLIPGNAQRALYAFNLGNQDRCDLMFNNPSLVAVGNAEWSNGSILTTSINFSINGPDTRGAILKIQTPDASPGQMFLVTCAVYTYGSPLQITVAGSGIQTLTMPNLGQYIQKSFVIQNSTGGVVLIQSVGNWSLDNIEITPVS